MERENTRCEHEGGGCESGEEGGGGGRRHEQRVGVWVGVGWKKNCVASAG